MLLGNQVFYNCFYMLPEIKGPQDPSQKQSKPMNYPESFYSTNDPQRRAQIREKNLQDFNQREVILISAEQEDREGYESKVEDQQLRYEITRAQLTGNRFNVILAIAKHYLPCPQQEKEAKMKEIVLDFFLEKANINISFGYFCPRIDAGLVAEAGRVYESRFLLFGVDLLTSKKIMNRFARYTPTLKWVDASHCILEFPSIQIGWEFIKFQTSRYEQEVIVPWEENQNVLARNWLELASYLEIFFTRRLFVRNLTELDQRYILSKAKSSESFDTYIRTKLEFENMLISNENIKKVLEKVDEDERNMRMMDPNYKSIMKKKRMEQKKIQNLVSEREYSNRNGYGNHQGRSRTRDQARDKRQNYHQYNNGHQKGFRRSNEGSQASGGFSKEHNGMPYRRDPRVYPGRNTFNRVQNPITRQRPSYATAEKMNEIREHLNQRPDLNQSFTSPPARNANHPSEYENPLNMSLTLTRNQIDPQHVILENEIQQIQNPNHQQEAILKKPFQQDSQSLGTSSQPSSSFNQIQRQLSKFHINSSEYSSILERSKHHYSQLAFQDSQQLSSSNFFGSNLTSQNNTSDIFFTSEFERQMGEIPHHERDKIEEQDDDEICELFNVSNANVQQEENGDLNFKVTKKALNYDDPETKETEAQRDNSGIFSGKKKLPKKKNMNKDAIDA